MKLKYLLASLLLLLMSLSIAEIFPIFPKESFWYPWYRSEYFDEIDRQYQTAIDAFLSMKLASKKDQAWIFLEEFAPRNGVDIKIYKPDGERFISRGNEEKGNDEIVQRIVNSSSPGPVSQIRGNRYYRAIPIVFEKPCRICHRPEDPRKIAGVMTFERQFDGKLYFTAERRIIFSIIALLCAGLTFLVIRWDPDRHVKRLFGRKDIAK
jgi:hypothetical protein